MEFYCHCTLCLFLDLGNNILYSCRSNCALIIELKFTYVKLIVVVVTLYAQTDTLDNITACNAGEVNLLLFPCVACNIAVWVLKPCVATFLLENEVEVRSLGFFQCLYGKLRVCAVAGLESCLVENYIGAGSSCCAGEFDT